MQRNFSFNTKHLRPAQNYYNKLMQEIDEAHWIGETDSAEFMQGQAEHIKIHYLDKGEVWYPDF